MIRVIVPSNAAGAQMLFAKMRKIGVPFEFSSPASPGGLWRLA